MPDKYLNINIEYREKWMEGPAFLAQYYWPNIQEIAYYYLREGIDLVHLDYRCVAIWRIKHLKTI